jgi:putative protease
MAESCHKIPELLAPAGGPAALHAAISNGADAVYLGLADLNARRGAENFDLQGLEAACRYAHLRDRRVYLAANVVVLADEMERAVRLVSDAWIAGVDAVIVQDLGLLKVVHATMPEVRLHASTQLNAHNAPTVDALADLGMTRVTLARETSLHEIAQLAATGDAVGIEVESFVHGALCISYSGQCLLSSLIGGRSANRGLCAQPCRMAYSLVGQDGSDLAAGGDYPLSPRDLAGIGVLPQLVESGVAALKIEGRMKSPEYVALVTGVYRRALDRAVADPAAFEVRDGEWDVLGEAFSRGFRWSVLSTPKTPSSSGRVGAASRSEPALWAGRVRGRPPPPVPRSRSKSSSRWRSATACFASPTPSCCQLREGRSRAEMSILRFPYASRSAS